MRRKYCQYLTIVDNSFHSHPPIVPFSNYLTGADSLELMPQTIKGEGINLESAPILDKADTNLEMNQKPDVSHFIIVVSPGWVGGNILANLSLLARLQQMRYHFR